MMFFWTLQTPKRLIAAVEQFLKCSHPISIQRKSLWFSHVFHLHQSNNWIGRKNIARYSCINVSKLVPHITKFQYICVGADDLSFCFLCRLLHFLFEIIISASNYWKICTCNCSEIKFYWKMELSQSIVFYEQFISFVGTFNYFKKKQHILCWKKICSMTN